MPCHVLLEHLWTFHFTASFIQDLTFSTANFIDDVVFFGTLGLDKSYISFKSLEKQHFFQVVLIGGVHCSLVSQHDDIYYDEWLHFAEEKEK